VALAANRTGPSNLLTCAIRPAGIFGEGDTMVLKQMIRLHREGRTNVQVGDNNNIFDFTYVGNVAHAHLLAARALLATHASPTIPLDTERVDGEAFIVNNDEPVYFWDFARCIWRYAGSDKGTDHVWVLARTPGMVVGFLAEVAAAIARKKPGLTRGRIQYSCMTRYYNIDKIKTRLGYRPQCSMEEGIKRGVAWFKEKDAAGEMVW
jgi:sterol-4alpha-carboxylate 3-dehydrogenase (decarboxylating)